MPNRPPKTKKFRAPPSTASRRCASINALSEPGDFCIMPRDEHQGIYELACIFPGATRPSGIIVKRVDSISIAPQLAPHVWNWDGKEETPTINPKIESTDSGRPWKGFLVAGKFVAV